MSLGGGDTLARGAKSATFSPNKNVSQQTWDLSFMSEAEFRKEYKITAAEYKVLKEGKQ